MADFFKGLAGGFGTGLQFGNAMQQREERERLREAMGLSPQEIAPRPPTQDELGRAQAYTQSIADQDARMFATDDSVQNRTGLFSNNPAERPIDASVAPQMPYVGQSVGGTQYRLGGQTFSRMPTQQEIDAARYAAASNVIAERDPVAAMRMRREMDEQAYQARIRPEQEAQMKRQGLLTEGQITEMNRNQARTKKIEDVDADVAQWQSSRLLDPNTNEPRQPTMDDNIAALQYRATALQKAGLAKEATDSLRDYQGFAVNQIKLDETQRNSQLGAVAAAIAAGDLNPAVAFYDRYVLDGAKVTGMKTDAKTGAITVSRVRDDGAPMPDKVIKGGANELLAALNSFRDPMALYNYSQNEFTNNLNLKKFNLQVQTENRQAAQDKTSPLEKNLAALKRLGVNVTPEEVKSMAGLKAPALSPEAAAQIEIITASLKDNSTPANIEAARTAVSDIFKGEGLKQRNATIVQGLRTASQRNDLPAALTQLQNAGVGVETIVGLARQAGVQLPANFAPAPAPPTPAAPARPTGLAPRSTSQQKYGPLTPMATIEADARAGNPDAIAYLRQQADYARNLERAQIENARAAIEGQ
jgi:hypothetical protein